MVQGIHLAPVQVKMARVALNLGVRDLAVLADVSPTTIFRLEGGYKMSRSTLVVVKTALESQGIEFIDEDGKGPGLRLIHP